MEKVVRKGMCGVRGEVDGIEREAVGKGKEERNSGRARTGGISKQSDVA